VRVNPYADLLQAILAAYPELSADDFSFGLPPKLELGDVAVPMFNAARKLRMAPPALAAQMAERVDFGPEVSKAIVTGPYVNLKLRRPAFARRIVAHVLGEGVQYGSAHTGRGKKAIIEHTSINPNASPHVGRARNAMIGDSLARLLRFEDYGLTVHYYVNDMGRQIGLLVLIADELENLTFDQILAAYVQANERAKEDPDFAERGYELLAKMEEGDPEAKEKFRNVTELCLNGQLAVLRRLGSEYDAFDRESNYVRDPRLDTVLEALRAKEAVFTDEEERLVVDLSKLGYPAEEGRYFVLMRANGSSMYGYRDLAYTIEKDDAGADLNLQVLGEDHKLYAQQVALIIGAAGHRAPEAIYYSYILLKEGKMSTRQGKVVLLSDFLDQAAALAVERVAEQCKDLTPEEQQVIAEQVAVAAIRFTVLRVNANKNVTFDMESALSFHGDTGPYVQYSCARINSILRKSGRALSAEVGENFPIESDAEWALLTRLAAFPEIVRGALAQRTTAPIAIYALDIAHLFTTFYHDCPVLTAGTPELTQARLHVCAATLRVLQNALGVLGIAAPERM
jgi:arginyl-tRNA synthetase